MIGHHNLNDRSKQGNGLCLSTRQSITYTQSKAKLEFQIRHSWYPYWMDWEWECEIENDVKWSHRMWTGSPRCLSCEDGSLVRKGNDFQTVQIYLQHSKNQKTNRSKISIKGSCSFQESEITSPMIRLCLCSNFRNKHWVANPSNVQIY